MIEKRALPVYPHPSWIEIDLSQFKKNIRILKHYLGKTKLCLPIKANAYGHGLCPIAKAAQEERVDYLAVAHLKEAIALRKEAISLPILVLGAIHEDQIADLLEWNVEISLSSKFKAELVAQKCREMGKKCRVHVEIDTGMQRTGVRPETAFSLLSYLKNIPHFEIAGIYSHLAKGEIPEDPTTLKQIETFRHLADSLMMQENSPLFHLANSQGVALFPSSYFNMVRPSLLTFGYLPSHTPQQLLSISPFFSLKSKISYFKVVEKGEGISYGHSYITSQRTRIVTIPIGYGDGYRRALSNKGSVLIRGKKFPIVGTICMDQLMVDIGNSEAYVGDEVVLIGKQDKEEISLTEIAKLCDTIPYEVLCFFNERIPRVYTPRDCNFF